MVSKRASTDEDVECSLSERNAYSIVALALRQNAILWDRHFNPKKQAQMSLARCRRFLLQVVLRGEIRAGESEQGLRSKSLNSKTFETPISLVKSKPMPPEGFPLWWSHDLIFSVFPGLGTDESGKIETVRETN